MYIETRPTSVAPSPAFTTGGFRAKWSRGVVGGAEHSLSGRGSFKKSSGNHLGCSREDRNEEFPKRARIGAQGHRGLPSACHPVCIILVGSLRTRTHGGSAGVLMRRAQPQRCMCWGVLGRSPPWEQRPAGWERTAELLPGEKVQNMRAITSASTAVERGSPRRGPGGAAGKPGQIPQAGWEKAGRPGWELGEAAAGPRSCEDACVCLGVHRRL